MKTAWAIFTQGLSLQYKSHLSQGSQNRLFELGLSERSHFRITLGFQNMLAERPACQPVMALPCAWQWQQLNHAASSTAALTVCCPPQLCHLECSVAALWPGSVMCTDGRAPSCHSQNSSHACAVGSGPPSRSPWHSISSSTQLQYNPFLAAEKDFLKHH